MIYFRVCLFIEMTSYMAKQAKKYIPLKEASVISGYTASELRNFTKIGLVPFRKQGSRLFIRFDAFEKLNEGQNEKSKTNSKTKTPELSMKSLVPFTTPNRTLVKILEPVAFAAALILTLQAVALPGVANKIESALEINMQTVDYMANTFSELITVGISVPLELGYRIATVSTLSAASVSHNTQEPVVAGISASTSDIHDAAVLTTSEEGVIAHTLISIADSADDFQRMLNGLSEKTLDVLVNPLEFSNIDSGVQSFFRL